MESLQEKHYVERALGGGLKSFSFLSLCEYPFVVAFFTSFFDLFLANFFF